MSKWNRVPLRKILSIAPEQYIIPIHHPKAEDILENTKTEVSDKFVAVQPPRKYVRLSPDRHRKVPVAPPGQDAVSALRREESARSGARPVQFGAQLDIIQDIWHEICLWRSGPGQSGGP